MPSPARCCGPALAQSGQKVYRLGVLAPRAVAFDGVSKALAARGLIEGRDVLSDVREGTPEELPGLARDLVSKKPDVILAVSLALGPARAATDTIPIVALGPDPVAEGVAESLSRPGGNVTGVALFASQLDGKRVELLASADPGRRIGVMIHPDDPAAAQSRREVIAMSNELGIEPLLFQASGPTEYGGAFAAMQSAGVRSLVITTNAWFFRDREILGRLARQAGIATMCAWGDMAVTVCTMGYGPVRREVYDRVADLIIKVTRGTPPGELPIERPGKLEVWVNLKAATALGLSVSPSLLARADEVIE